MAFCRNYIPFSLPAFSGPTDHRQIHAALVWRHIQCLDNLYAYVSMPSARRLPLCSFTGQVISKIPVHITYPPARRIGNTPTFTKLVLGNSHSARKRVETSPWFHTVCEHHTHPCRMHRTAFHHSFFDKRASTGMVRTAIPG